MERLTVAGLKELDAIVGRYLTKETPHVFWEERQVSLRFDSLEEAVEAMRDPYYQEFIPKGARPHSALSEVQEFRPYSSDLSLAWELIEQLSADTETFHVSRENGDWRAAFGNRPPAVSHSAPVAICLAALRARGMEVELAPESMVTPPRSWTAA